MPTLEELSLPEEFSTKFAISSKILSKAHFEFNNIFHN